MFLPASVSSFHHVLFEWGVLVTKHWSEIKRNPMNGKDELLVHASVLVHVFIVCLKARLVMVPFSVPDLTVCL